MTTDARDTARVEAFSDGVFAIAITLLVLELKVPPENVGTSLGRALLELWPSYLAFLTSFFTIGIMWLNHHRLFSMIQRTDHTLVMLNLLLMLGITAVPFPTALVAEHLGHEGEKTAAMVYSGTYVVIAIVFNVLWRYAARGRRLLGSNVDATAVEKQTRQYVFGPVVYFIAFLVALVSAPLSFWINMAIAAFFALPPMDLRLRRR
jgi:uncharacterized membrane protein